MSVEAMCVRFDQAVSEGDVEETKAMYGILADAASGVSRLIRSARLTRQEALGATFPPSAWRDMSPEQILLDLQNFVGIEDAMIESKQAKVPGSRSAQAKRLSQEIAKMIRDLRRRVAVSRTYILTHFPEHWTEDQERAYGPWL
jgi:hypothetical protein